MKSEYQICPYQEQDFPAIQRLNAAEGWNQLVRLHDRTKLAWQHSNAAFVVEHAGEVVGYVRGMTDTQVTLYICELLIDAEFRGQGLAQQLFARLHEAYPTTRIEVLASSSSESFYRGQAFRPFYGFRKSFE
ncbi:GNAT family N-acetyltransferase [Exiguobacterium sp. s138]|uniref:GNAT family N-acetyltransferase n=1 Tax=Exiguobacterium sp. s138 TaxID=2751202 RepID=UPI001BE70E29|nr:GNAT family N-acetyltransferase [Exiguobacterium sp. s138]